MFCRILARTFLCARILPVKLALVLVVVLRTNTNPSAIIAQLVHYYKH
jgi:hypothetical protein